MLSIYITAIKNLTQNNPDYKLLFLGFVHLPIEILY